MNVDDKFITGKLYISSPQDVGCYNVFFGDNITIIALDNGNYIAFLPPYPDRKLYKDNFSETTTNNRNEEHKLRNFFWDCPNKMVLENTNCLSEKNIFDKDNMKLSINSQDTICVDMPKKTDKDYSGQLKLKENKSFTITPSTTLTKLANALPELPENIKQAMNDVDNEIKLESEIAKQLQAQLGTDFVKTDHITSIEQKERETQEANKENQQLQNTNKQISPSIKPSEIAKQLQAQLGTDFVKKEHITSIEQKELGNPNEQTKLENQQKEIFCSPTIWCGLNLCSLCDTWSKKQIS